VLRNSTAHGAPAARPANVSPPQPPSGAGVAALVPSEQSSAAALVRLADAALYRAKAAGGDRIEVAPAADPPAPSRRG